MKNFLSSTKGKIIAGASTAGIVAAVIIAVVLINSGYRTIAVEALNGVTNVINGSGQNDAYVGLHLKSGDEVKVSSDADLTLSMDEDKHVYAEPDTHFWVVAKGRLTDTRTDVKMDAGSNLFRIDNKLTGNEYFNVDTPNATMSVRGTVFRVSCYVDKNGEYITELDVFEGEVYVERLTISGEKTGDYRILGPGMSIKIGNLPDDTEYLKDENGDDIFEIAYKEISKGAAEFIGRAIDDGRIVCIEKDLLFDYTGLAPHDFVAIGSEIAATCSKEGAYDQVCQVCNLTEHITVPALEHNTKEEISEGKSCGETGKKTVKCVDCGKIISVSDTEPREHSFDDGKVIKEPTKKTPGIIRYTCQECKETKDEEIPPLGDGLQKPQNKDEQDKENTNVDAAPVTIPDKPQAKTPTDTLNTSTPSSQTPSDSGKGSDNPTGNTDSKTPNKPNQKNPAKKDPATPTQTPSQPAPTQAPSQPAPTQAPSQPAPTQTPDPTTPGTVPQAPDPTTPGTVPQAPDPTTPSAPDPTTPSAPDPTTPSAPDPTTPSAPDPAQPSSPGSSGTDSGGDGGDPSSSSGRG